MPPQEQKNTDFDPKDLTKTVDKQQADLDDLKKCVKGLEGTEFYQKIATAIKESKLVENEIKKVAWATVKDRIVWIILGGLGIIFTDLVLRAIPSLLSKF